jgi:hypothetical protein
MIDPLINSDIKKNTDPKPVIYDFEGESDILVLKFFKKIKPINGIIKYKMTKWNEFPKDIEEAKTLSKLWIKKFNKNSNYSNVNVNIYFHVIKKIIRFEVKEKNMIKIDNLELNSFLENLKPEKNTLFFDISDIGNIDIDKSKDFSKNLALEIEKYYSENNIKAIVFVNNIKKYVKINLN